MSKFVSSLQRFAELIQHAYKHIANVKANIRAARNTIERARVEEDMLREIPSSWSSLFRRTGTKLRRRHVFNQLAAAAAFGGKAISLRDEIETALLLARKAMLVLVIHVSAVPRFGEFFSCCCLPLLPQHECNILST